jgi:hypothetical protein
MPLFVGCEARLHIEVRPDAIEGYTALCIPHLPLDLIQTGMTGGAKIEGEFRWEKECLELDGVQLVWLVIFFFGFLASLSLRWS